MNLYLVVTYEYFFISWNRISVHINLPKYTATGYNFVATPKHFKDNCVFIRKKMPKKVLPSFAAQFIFLFLLNKSFVKL